ncbi:MAG: TetR/AcrR family transcriptional regulator, partial [Pseudomonadota bacterium]
MSDPSDTRADIRAAALRVLLAEGLPYLSNDRVAQEAGVTRQLVRYHFPEAEALMLAVAEDLAALYREALTTGMAGRAGPDRLSFFFDVSDGAAKPADDQAYDALLSLAARSPAIRDNLRGGYQLLGQVISHEVRQAYPALPMASCEELAYLLVALMYGHWKMVASLGFVPENTRIARAAMDRLLASY